MGTALILYRTRIILLYIINYKILRTVVIYEFVLYRLSYIYNMYLVLLLLSSRWSGEGVFVPGRY